MDFIINNLWPIIAGFLILGGQWYWNNKKTKEAIRSINLENESKSTEVESKEITNMKEIMVLFQNNFKNELVEKNDTIAKLSTIILDLNKKIDLLSIEIKALSTRLDSNDEDILKIATGCSGKRRVGEVCAVVKHLNSKKDANKQEN